MRMLLTGLLFFCCCLNSVAADGIVNVKSSHDVPTTAERLAEALQEKGMTVFARIDHSAGAAVGLELRPTQLVIFGNPKVGSPLMQCRQSVAIDLPQKALIWQDEAGLVWLSYNDPQYLDRRHQLGSCAEAARQKVAGALSRFAELATTP